MIDDNEGFIWISDDNHLNHLVDQIERNRLFGNQFKFSNRDLFLTLLERLEIDYEVFSKNHFYVDSDRNLHISESHFEYVWISTHGLIAKNKATSNKVINSCINQHIVISLLLEKAIEISQSESVYDVDSYDFGYLCELSPALFHNILFYIEVFCKAYLSLNAIQLKKTHKLSLIYMKSLETMYAKKHNNSLFHAQILDPLSRFVDHVNSIPGNFREQYVKYDDNPNDDTVIIFKPERLHDVMTIFELSHDFIMDFFYKGEETFYLKSGLYQKMLDNAESQEERDRIRRLYSHLNENNNSNSFK